ncbi:MAG: hypothetical protein ACETV1_04820, partial [Candidatus Bathyarchaeia archaeon]
MVDLIKFLIVCSALSIPTSYVFVKFYLNVLDPLETLLVLSAPYLLASFFVREDILTRRIGVLIVLVLFSMIFASTISSYVLVLPFMVERNEPFASVVSETLLFSSSFLLSPKFMVYFLFLFFPFSFVSVLIGSF